MQGTSLETSQSLTREQKCAALEAVMRSQTFARSDQLKSFLRYVCEMEMVGRGNELTEYLIGIEALGRPASYSPGEDSAVRTRAFALRKKLQEFYEHEQPDATLHIELLKGSYCPHYIEIPPPQNANESGTSAENILPQPVSAVVTQEGLPLTETATRRKWESSWLFPFFAGVMLTALISGGLWWWRFRTGNNTFPPPPPAILAEAWGPLLMPDANVILCVANPPAFSVLPGPFSQPPPNTPLIGERPLPRDLYTLFAARYPPSTNLSLTFTNNASYWGDTLGAFTAFRTLSASGVSPQMFPEMVTSLPTLRHRNLILFGAPAYSATVSRFLENCPLQVKYLDAIVSSDAQQKVVDRYELKRDLKQRIAVVFGLITVLPGESSNNVQHRTVIFSGVNSAGAQAAAEFFSSPDHLVQLKKELINLGYNSFPPAYQVVVKAKTDDSILLNFEFETCRIFQPAANH